MSGKRSRWLRKLCTDIIGRSPVPNEFRAAKDALKGIDLSAESKERIRARLLSAINTRPAVPRRESIDQPPVAIPLSPDPWQRDPEVAKIIDGQDPEPPKKFSLWKRFLIKLGFRTKCCGARDTRTLGYTKLYCMNCNKPV